MALYIYAGDKLVAVEKNGNMYYVHTNHRGDILALTDINGTQVATYKYGPWGEFLGKTGTVDIPFRYAGYYYDNETGLYYLKSRYYNPELSRFLTKDDIDYSELNEPQSLNLYAYTKNNPIMYVDPDGNYSIRAFFIRGIGVITLLASGAVVAGYFTWNAGSWLSKKVRAYQASHRSTKNGSKTRLNNKHTRVRSGSQKNKAKKKNGWKYRGIKKVGQ